MKRHIFASSNFQKKNTFPCDNREYPVATRTDIFMCLRSLEIPKTHPIKICIATHHHPMG
jgi:hypothetical protein